MGIPKINKEECTGCEECVEACPAEAITMKDDVAVINDAECTECGACVDECPAEAITDDD
jgi:Fe-S-cluster-containing hydrogenase component 2